MSKRRLNLSHFYFLGSDHLVSIQENILLIYYPSCCAVCVIIRYTRLLRKNYFDRVFIFLWLVIFNTLPFNQLSLLLRSSVKRSTTPCLSIVVMIIGFKTFLGQSLNSFHYARYVLDATIANSNQLFRFTGIRVRYFGHHQLKVALGRHIG